MQGGQPGPWHCKAIISRDLSRQGEGEGATGDFPAPALPLQPFWQQVFRDQTGRQAGHVSRPWGKDCPGSERQKTPSKTNVVYIGAVPVAVY